MVSIKYKLQKTYTQNVLSCIGTVIQFYDVLITEFEVKLNRIKT